MGVREAARARIQTLLDFIDAIKYIKSTLVNDLCTAQWSHKLGYVCMPFGGFFVFFIFVVSYMKVFGPYAW